MFKIKNMYMMLKLVTEIWYFVEFVGALQLEYAYIVLDHSNNGIHVDMQLFAGTHIK